MSCCKIRDPALLARKERRGRYDESPGAFLVHTGEDEVGETKRARENVVHEAGLFQGRLGFKKAIVVLEEGCNQYSNIAGLTQIRFPRGSIRNAFLEIREVIDREFPGRS